MANFSDLPTEIWLLIAQHLNVPRLSKLKSLNSFFFNCYLDMRWERVEIDGSLESKAVHDLERMVDPFLQTRTKSLIIRLDNDQSEYFTTNLLTSLPLLPNIASLNIIIEHNSTTDSATLFQTITSSSMARALRKLRLAVDVDMLGPFAESSPKTSFENLTVLFLDLDLHRWSSSHLPTEFPPALSSFLRILAPTLQGLRISNLSKGHDLSPLFDTLSEPTSLIPFPRLHTLFLFFGFSNAEALQVSHQSLLRFLAHHNKLQYLHLKLDAPISNRDEKQLGVWLTELVNYSKFSSLQTLGIYPSTTPDGLSAVLALIKRTAPTLTSLIIYDHSLTHEEAARLLDVLEFQDHTLKKPRNLKSLEMVVSQLTTTFLDLLACKLPQLEKLTLWARRVVGSDQHSFIDSLQRRRYNPNITFTQDTLHTWKLQNLSIRSGPFFNLDKDAIRAVADAVPALAHNRV